MSLIKAYLADQDGATAIEYGLIAALIAVGMIVGAGSVGSSISNLFGGTDSELQGVFGKEDG